MDYRDALEIARKNPGYSVTRTDEGDFAVFRPDGSRYDVPINQESEIETLERERDRLQSRYDDLHSHLDEVKRSHRAEIVAYDAKIHELRVTLHNAREEIEGRNKQIQQLEAKIKKVSPEEWQRIKTADEKDLEEYAKAKRLECHEQVCSCRGEVENCVRCDGKGRYTTDGFGNIVSS